MDNIKSMRVSYICLTCFTVVVSAIVILAFIALLAQALSYTNQYLGTAIAASINIDIAICIIIAGIIGLTLLLWLVPIKVLVTWFVMALATVASAESFIAIYLANNSPHSEWGGLGDAIAGLLLSGIFSASSLFLATAALILSRRTNKTWLRNTSYLCLIITIAVTIFAVLFSIADGFFMLLVLIPVVTMGIISYCIVKYFRKFIQQQSVNVGEQAPM
jgi:hypothetical protein